MSDTGDSGTVSDTGDGSVLSDWSVVDQHGDLPDDDTASTTSSVEVVDEDEDNTAQHFTPVAGSPGSVAPRFVLRLPSHGQDVSDTDEDPVDNSNISHTLDDRSDAGLIVQLASSKPPSISSAGLDAGQTFRQNAAIARVSKEELDELRQTLDLLKKNLQPSMVDDSSLSNEMFGDGRSDNNDVPMKMPADEQPSHRPVEDIGIHGDELSDAVSMASSVSSSYSFLSKDAGTNCSLVTDTIEATDVRPKSPDDHQTQLEETANHESPDADQIEQPEDDFPMEVVHEENVLTKFMLLMSEFPVQFVVLAGLMCYTGLVILLVLYCSLPGLAFQEKNAFSSCTRYNAELSSRAVDCRDEYYCHHGDDSRDITDDIERCNTTRDKEIESLRDEIERLRKQDKDASHTTVQVTYTLIRNDMDYSHIKSDISKDKFTEEIEMVLKDKEQFKLLLKETHEITDKIKNAQKDFVNLTDELVAIKEEKEKTNLSMEVEMNSHVLELMDKQAELYSENERLQGMLNESRTRSTDWKSYLDNKKRQSEKELYDVRRQCKTDLDRLRKQAEADVQLSRGHCPLNTEQGKGHSGQGTAGDQPNTKNTKKEKEDNQSKKRNGKSSDNRKRDENKPTDEDDQSEKEHYSEKENHSGRVWADTVLDMMNKTKGHIQDTWATVKNMSESMWTKHKPTVHRLQDAFTRKLHNLSTRVKDKLMRNMNKWFRKDKKHEQQQNDGHNANTKRQKFGGHDQTIKSDVTVESRLVKLSQKVAELNARKFNKWSHGPKIVDIQREFNDVDLIVKRGPAMDDKDRLVLADSHLKWFQCQFQWWKALDVVPITDDCYPALCCWQVKVTGGDVKQCRKVKRKLGIVEDMCTLEHASKYMKHQVKPRLKTMGGSTINEDHYETPSETNSYSQNTENEMDEDRRREALNQFLRHKNNNAQNTKDGKQKSAGVDGEVNWFLDMGKDREYHRGEPDNWFFRRNDKTVPEDETKSRFTRPDIDLDDSDFEDENYYGNWDL